MLYFLSVLKISDFYFFLESFNVFPDFKFLFRSSAKPSLRYLRQYSILSQQKVVGCPQKPPPFHTFPYNPLSFFCLLPPSSLLPSKFIPHVSAYSFKLTACCQYPLPYNQQPPSCPPPGHQTLFLGPIGHHSSPSCPLPALTTLQPGLSTESLSP